MTAAEKRAESVERERERHRALVAERAAALGCTEVLAEYLLSLEDKVSELESDVVSLRSDLDYHRYA